MYTTCDTLSFVFVVEKINKTRKNFYLFFYLARLHLPPQHDSFFTTFTNEVHAFRMSNMERVMTMRKNKATRNASLVIIEKTRLQFLSHA